MHVLSGFSQRRKSKPRDLHIRKVSFSGSSLSSGCSFSSTSSASTAQLQTPRLPYSATTVIFDPLSLHPTFQAPKRLHERPILISEKEHYEPVSAFYDSEDSDSDLDVSEKDFSIVQQPQMDLPHASPLDQADYEQDDEPEDYFFMHIAKRPSLPRSRWSESTIATIETLDELNTATSMSGPPSACSFADVDEEAQVSAAVQPVPNFSYKRNTVPPKRPSCKAINNFDDYIKRGGWKRKGIVFHNEAMDNHASM